ncbi:hypothetical protein MYBA111488_23225 [Mycobacterium basiliense]
MEATDTDTSSLPAGSSRVVAIAAAEFAVSTVAPMLARCAAAAVTAPGAATTYDIVVLSAAEPKSLS